MCRSSAPLSSNAPVIVFQKSVVFWLSIMGEIFAPISMLVLLMLQCQTGFGHLPCFDKDASQAEAIFTGKIVEIFGSQKRPKVSENSHFSNDATGNLSALVEVKRVYKGDFELSQTHIVVEFQTGFFSPSKRAKKSCGKRHFRPFSEGDTRLFFTSVVHYGVYRVISPLVHVNLRNLRYIDDQTSRKRGKIFQDSIHSSLFYHHKIPEGLTQPTDSCHSWTSLLCVKFKFLRAHFWNFKYLLCDVCVRRILTSPLIIKSKNILGAAISFWAFDVGTVYRISRGWNKGLPWKILWKHQYFLCQNQNNLNPSCKNMQHVYFVIWKWVQKWNNYARITQPF